ncbi:hypothetical protein IQ17_03199 [Bradyrhizobium daqingense]|uniref:Uncharacterized protein n=1 Tax=Bradyrhizobium daqingense TaxID=993502 RepID=A0A562LDH6_9BRAD|nr:hypothetical protein IQ17_03199 [Bradyrhizobium daqingense]
MNGRSLATEGECESSHLCALGNRVGECLLAVPTSSRMRTGIVRDVMAGLVPVIHVFPRRTKNVDARDKPGHDAHGCR